MKNILLFFTAILASTSIYADVVIAENSNAKMQIVLSDNPTAVEKTSATELKEHLDSICGADFKITSQSKKDANTRSIYIGDFAETKKILGCQDFSKLGYDTIKIKTTENGDIALCGHPKRGSLYAVYTLLEDYIGVRWWSQSERYLPNKPTLRIVDVDLSYTPKLMLREALYKIGFDGIFASKMRQNGATLTRMNFDRPVIPVEYGGCDTLVLFKGRGSSFHSHYEIIPPAKYFKDHPEWFSLIEGKRSHHYAQLCLTNEEMTQEYIKNIKQLLRENPKATSIQVSQNDCYGACQCKKCKAIDDENESQSGSNIYFANRIGEAIENEFPNVWIDTFAYQYTRKAPKKIKPRKNVLVRLCTIECSFVKPLECATEMRNQTFVNDMKEWGKITNNLFIWDYVTAFYSYMMPHPNMRVLAPNIRFFVNNSALGIFEQGDAFCSAGDFVLMRNWVISHLMWNPNLNEEILFDEFLFGYYGKEVGSIFKEYLNVIHDRAETSGQFIGCVTEGLRWIDAKTFNKASALIKKANETAVRLEKSDPKKYAGLVNKTRRESLSFQHISLVYSKMLQKYANLEGVEIDLPKDPKKAVEELISTWKEMKVETWREFTTPAEFEQYQQKLRIDIDRQFFAKTIKIPAKDKSELFSFVAPEFSLINTPKNINISAELTKDSNACTGYALKVPVETGYHLRVPIELTDLKFDENGKANFTLYAVMRADVGKANEKHHCVRVSVNNIDWKILDRRFVKLDEVAGKDYKTIKLFNLTVDKGVGSMYIVVRSLEKTATTDGVYVDRIFAKQN